MAGVLPRRKTKANMENQEEKETSIDYYFRITKNYAFNLGRLIEFYVVAKKLYDMEIENAYKKGYSRGYVDRANLGTSIYK